MPDFPVFNLSLETPFSISVPGGFLDLPPRRWTRVSAETISSYRLALEPQLKIDWSIGSQADLLPPPAVTVAGPSDSVTSYGILTLESAQALKDMGLDVHMDLCGLVRSEDEGVPQWAKESLRNRVVQAEKALCCAVPYELPRVLSSQRYLYTMHEAGGLPKDWDSYISNWSQAVFVPCEELAELWTPLVDKPVHVVPIGVADEWRFQERLPHDKFEMLMFGRLSGRKAPIQTLVDVVLTVLGDQKGWRLTLKTQFGQIGASSASIQHPNIRVISDLYSTQDMMTLCGQADVGLCLSAFEGWGMVPRQMMATGLEVILSNHSGHRADCDDRYNYPVKPLGKTRYDAMEGYWYENDVEAAKEALWACWTRFQATGGAQSDKGRNASRWIKARRNWRSVAHQLSALMQLS